MSSISYGLYLDRESNAFEIAVNYDIPGYDDPETGEQFYSTSWNYSFSDQFGGGGTGNWGAQPSETVIVYMGFPSSEDVSDGTLTFYAQNDFSGVNISLSLHILNAGMARTDKVILGTAASEIILSGYGADVLRGYAGNDYLDSGDGDDILEGGDGNDQLLGGAGNDIMTGGIGDDEYMVDSAGDVVVETSNGGASDYVIASVNYTLSPHIEALALTGDARNGFGNEQNNDIYGNSAVNILEGRGGNDRLYGNDGDDRLKGGNGNDYLDGGTGKDVMEGGLGNDQYVIDRIDDGIVELAGQGVDEARVQGLAAYTLGANVENMTNIGNFVSFRGTGNALVNILWGNNQTDILSGLAGNDTLMGMAGNDLLEGGVGGDTLNGGDGIDKASYANATSGITANLQTNTGTRGEANGDKFVSIEGLVGSAFDDVLTGDAGGNRLAGGAGNDILRGGDGDDWLVGGAGADRLEGDAGEDGVSYDTSLAGVTINLLTQSVSGGDANGDILVSISRAEGSNFADMLTGTNGDNWLFGRAGNDVINGLDGADIIRGGAGADIMNGGLGNDTLDYTGSSAGVIVNLMTQTGSGGDANGDTFTGFERVKGTAFADTLTGDNGANILNGDAGIDTLSGGDGNDTIIGGAGADVMDGGAGIDTLSYVGSSESVYISMGSNFGYFDAAGDSFVNFENLVGGSTRDYLYGDGGNNRIEGRAGNDWLAGFGGNDTLYGGEDSDTFLFEWGFDVERIMDFVPGASSGDALFINLGEPFDTFAEVMAVGAQVGANTVFTFLPGQSLILNGVSMSSLTEQDFVFPVPEEFF